LAGEVKKTANVTLLNFNRIDIFPYDVMVSKNSS